MPDYNLYGLSSRSFEQLIQAISARIIGPGLVVFGDGPDGAREATFEGQTAYTSDGEPWEGYVVVQAKFHQRFQSSEAEGKWATNALAKELKKFSERKRKLKTPEYYVFCTNVVLSPGQGTGYKDRILTLLHDFARKKGLKGYALWDSDQLRVYLDSLPEVRQTYAAWITPGDVLSTVINSLRLQRPNFESVMASFLQKELLADQYVNLEQAGHTNEEKTPMARVFVDLLATRYPASDPVPTPEEEEGVFTGFVSEFLKEGSYKLQDVPEAQDGAPRDGKPSLGRFVLVGGPGQGKTTIGQFVCQLHRVSLLRGYSRKPMLPEVRAAMDLIERHCSTDALSLPVCKRFPFRIVLNHLARELSSPSGPRTVLSYITTRIKIRTDYDVDQNDIRQWLAQYPWVMVLDGLDEVPPASNRDDVLTAIQDFWVDVSQLQSDILILATTRPQGYEQDFSPQFYSHRYLSPLSSTRALHYGSRLATARYGNDKDREQRVTDRLRRASGEESTARLMRSPLQVTIMATLVDQTGQPPRERWRLFHEYYEVVYKREMERDIPAANILREHKSNIDHIHHQVGLILQIESENAGQTDARLPASRFGRVVEARLAAEGYKEKELARLKAKIIEAATHRLVFLVGMQANQVGFEIRSLQEFMAAESLTETQDDVVAHRLDAIASLSHWQNVFLFAAGKCFAIHQHLRDTILRICTTLNESDGSDLGPRLLLGSQLALELLIDGAAHQQPKFERSLGRLALKLLDRADQSLQVPLAAAYQSTLEEVYREELGLRLRRSSVSEQIGAWGVLLGLIERDVKWSARLGTEIWPRLPEDRLQILAAYLEETIAFPERVVTARWLTDAISTTAKDVSLTDCERAGLFWISTSKSGPEWFRAVARMFGYRLRFSRSVLPFEGVGASINPVLAKASTGVWRAAMKLPQRSPDWALINQLGSFSLEPDVSKLVMLLKNLSEIWSPTLGQLIARISPWPVAESILSCRTKEDVVHAASLGERGQLGNLESWLRAEHRWNQGIKWEDLVASDSNGAIPGPYLEKAGFPFLSAALGWRQEPDDERRALSAYSNLKTRTLKSSFARFILNLARMSGRESPAPKKKAWLSLSLLSDLLQYCDEPYLPVSELAPMLGEQNRDADLLALDQICRRATFFADSHRIVGEVAGKVSRIWAQNHHLEGLTLLLAACAADSDVYSFLTEPLRWPLSEPKFENAALILKLVHTRPTPSEARAIALDLASRRGGGQYDWIRLAAQASANRHLDRAVAEQSLLALYSVVSNDRIEVTKVISVLDDMARRRRSDLAHEERRASLQLGFLAT
jgi:hypothetical protein